MGISASPRIECNAICLPAMWSSESLHGVAYANPPSYKSLSAITSPMFAWCFPVNPANLFPVLSPKLMGS